jgi:hypothetical protein
VSANLNPAPPPGKRTGYLRVGIVGRMLGLELRQVGRLVEKGDLAAPMHTPGGRRWRLEDVEDCRRRRAAAPGPSNRRWMGLGPAKARAVHAARRDLFRAGNRVLELGGGVLLEQILRHWGAWDRGVRGWPPERVHRLAAALSRAAEMVHG